MSEIEALHEMVDEFEDLMRSKLILNKQRGFMWWDDPETLPDSDLVRSLKENVEEGDWVDVANLAAILWYRKEK